jgi:hypothetical protein
MLDRALAFNSASLVLLERIEEDLRELLADYEAITELRHFRYAMQIREFTQLVREQVLDGGSRDHIKAGEEVNMMKELYEKLAKTEADPVVYGYMRRLARQGRVASTHELKKELHE